MQRQSPVKISLRRLLTLCVTVLCAAAVPTQSAELTMAYVQGKAPGERFALGDHGNAWLFHRGGQCYALLPRHVLVDPAVHRDYRYAELKLARPGQPMSPALADRCAVFKSMDLALMRVSGIEALADCGDELVGAPSIDAELSRDVPITLAIATEFGQLQSIPMRLRSVGGSEANIFHVLTQDPGFELTGGMSGGLFIADDGTLMGMLLNVSGSAERASRADARALRFDDMAATLARYFADPASVATVDQPSCDAPQSAQTVSAAEGITLPATPPAHAAANRADMACGAAVIGWSASPLGPEFRPENLVGREGAKATWRASANGEATVDLQLCPAPGNTVSEVRIDHSGCESGDDRGAQVEVLVGQGPEEGFTSLGYGALEGASELEVKSGVPMLGRQLRLRFVVSGNQTLCAGPLQVR